MSDLRRVLSSARPGVERAALDAALDLGFEVGGWTPKGHGPGEWPSRYGVLEVPGRGAGQAVEWNVRDSDGTLVLAAGRPSASSGAVEQAHKMGKPVLVVDLLKPRELGGILFWLDYCKLRSVHVAGPGESEVPGIRAVAMEFLRGLLLATKGA